MILITVEDRFINFAEEYITMVGTTQISPYPHLSADRGVIVIATKGSNGVPVVHTERMDDIIAQYEEKICIGRTNNAKNVYEVYITDCKGNPIRSLGIIDEDRQVSREGNILYYDRVSGTDILRIFDNSKNGTALKAYLNMVGPYTFELLGKPYTVFELAQSVLGRYQHRIPPHNIVKGREVASLVRGQGAIIYIAAGGRTPYGIFIGYI